MHTSRFATKGPRYANALTIRLPQPTSYTPELAAQARWGLEKIYRPGFQYHKAGVMVLDMVPENGPKFEAWKLHQHFMIKVIRGHDNW